ncbi:MAG: imelysin family protein [Ideonella sp.]|nr:imelysin family protein [Ideonella sp.]
MTEPIATLQLGLGRRQVLGLLALTPVWLHAAPPPTDRTAVVQAVVQHHAVLVQAAYADSLSLAQDLSRRIAAFVAAPSASTLNAARDAWTRARQTYGQTEAFRFYGGPIDAEDGPEARINAWPLDEAYIDSVIDRPGVGFINNPAVPLNKASLTALNERDGEENVATGWHAIEFLLWGQDERDDGPGQRSADDFIDGKAPNAARRRQALSVMMGLLLDDLGLVLAAWAPGGKNYRAQFEQGGMASVRNIIIGVGTLSRGELAGERIEVAMASRQQEDEHSCFSDTTHHDIVANAQGLLNVWTGRYQRLDGSPLEGPGLKVLIGQLDKALAERLDRQMHLSVRLAQAIPAPFDQQIKANNKAGRAKLKALVDSLSAQARDLARAAQRLGIQQLNMG